MKRLGTAVIAFVAVYCFPKQSIACGAGDNGAGDNGADTMALTQWVMTDDSTQVGFEVSLFPPEEPTTCACGMGVGSAGSGLPETFRITKVKFIIVEEIDANTARQTSVVKPFSTLELNENTTRGLKDGPVLIEDATWGGFSGVVQPFTSAQIGLDPNEKVLMVFSFEGLDPDELINKDLQFAVGLGKNDGAPDFDDPNHPLRYFTSPPLSTAIPGSEGDGQGDHATAVRKLMWGRIKAEHRQAVETKK